MTRHLGRMAALICLASSCWSATYTVTNTSNGSVGSLRWAIEQANANAGTHTIDFAAGMDGKTIRLDFALPALTRDGTQIDGDLDNDGHPNIVLDGVYVNSGSGLSLGGRDQVVDGLAIVNFPEAGVEIHGANGCRVEHCHLGVALGGRATVANDDAGVSITGGNEHIIQHNLLAGATPAHACVSITGGNDSAVSYNWFGLKIDGNKALPVDGYGVRITSDADPDVKWHNVEHNVFAALDFGVEIEGSDTNTVAGNLFGLADDGNTARPLTACGVRLVNGAADNQVGGPTAGERNVFVGELGSSYGVICTGYGASSNRIQGNYFGCNEAGTARKPLQIGIFVGNGAGAQTVGGNTVSRGNYVNVDAVGTSAVGLDVYDGGDGLLVRNNTFGLLPDGHAAPIESTCARVRREATVTFRNNRFVAGRTGIAVSGPSIEPSMARVYNNTFRRCERAVSVAATGSSAQLGNLGNASTSDDGGNFFKSDNTWDVYNLSAKVIKAEGNDWDATTKAAINAKIWDRRDDASLGKVDFDPLEGGVSPTGDIAAPLQLTGACAVPTRGGAEIAFVLSSPAEVTVEVLNVAGRHIATLTRDLAAEGGMHRVLWSGCADTGLRAPSGRYLVRITARNADGEQASGVTAVAWR